MRTSQSHPLQIAAVRSDALPGRIGITFCPGKIQPGAMSGSWNRDLGLDLDAIAAWGATAVVTLVEDHELQTLQVPRLGAEVAARHMSWFHLPIPDVSVPDAAFEARWETVGRDLCDRLRAGFDVVVHCKGGLGRAGTIAARMLIELGDTPDDAIAKVRTARPGAIETAAQQRYVLRQQARWEEVPATTSEAVRDRAVGALLGLAVGDAVGTTLEFTIRDSQGPLTDMVGGGPFHLKPGQWTDDTAMALALADSLAQSSALDEADLMRRFVDWHERGTYSCTGRCFDIGITTRHALARWTRSGDPMAGSTDPMSAGNGSLMRLAPVAIAHLNDRARLRDVAARQSRTTHAAPEAVDACVAYAECLADAIEGRPRSDVLRNRSEGYAGAIDGIMAGSWRGKPRTKIRASGYVAHSLEASLWSVARSGSFREAVLIAANLGEDADTTGAITGQLAGALGGAGAIPPDWLAKLAWRDRLVAAAEALLSKTVAD
ncbi:ADP-ribosylglycohydrolase family protein [Salipiger sp. 1_MG-2023]|uniref:ADP-ribosylglycohydrolase family protein n=1 Tax=Salipiger sp. 1_MG-2023 TaxID=3062665 RepID=UPI0026E443B4|nr:ADP-ribosylglycohydrolase family protein [Salipiger sp. 1_MG-2023]MDO6588144.1 ADP-ribosylglycohydrolase family protein [Salipiger sp. 1_MG-2023]